MNDDLTPWQVAASARDALWARLKDELQEYRTAAAESQASIPEVERRCRELLEERVRGHQADAFYETGAVLGSADVEWLHGKLDELLGAGPLERFLRNPDVENIYCYGPELCVLSFAGGTQEVIRDPLWESPEAMVKYIAQLAASHGQTGRRFDEAAPLLDLRLRTNERLFAATAVCSLPYVTIRRHRLQAVSLDELVELGSLTAHAAEFLQAAVRPPMPANLLIGGALGAGKTTLMRALLGEIAETEFICTIEQTFELFLDTSHERTFAVETREGNIEGVGAIDIEELSRRSLRSSVDRVVLGELRGKEAAMFLSACGTGSDGSMATIHAATPHQAVARLVRYCLEDPQAPPQHVIEAEVADVLHLVVHVRRDFEAGRRYVSAIAEVTPGDAGGLATRDVFASRPGGDLEFVSLPASEDILVRLTESGYNGPDTGEGSG